VVRISLPVLEEVEQDIAMNRSIILNFILFQLGWFACVLGGAYGYPLLGSLVALSIITYHCYRAADAIKEARLLLLALIVGLVFESIIASQGLAHYSNGQLFDFMAPVWMILMWPLFATTLNLSMRWMKGLAPILVALLGAVSAPLAYYAGNRLGAVSYEDITLSLAVIAAAWAVLLPALVVMSLKLDGYHASIIKRTVNEQPQHV
jgi:Protein of unknown function (DUF2878)